MDEIARESSKAYDLNQSSDTKPTSITSEELKSS